MFCPVSKAVELAMERLIACRLGILRVAGVVLGIVTCFCSGADEAELQVKRPHLSLVLKPCLNFCRGAAKGHDVLTFKNIHLDWDKQINEQSVPRQIEQVKAFNIKGCRSK